VNSLALLIPLLVTVGCLNPFAPEEGSAGAQTWTDQKTVGGLLENFGLSYDYRDSLRYADCLARSFEFTYYDDKNGRDDRWFRDTDLKTTGGLFRYYDKIDLEWNFIPVYAENFSQPDTTLDFIVKFNLTIGDEPPLIGYAHFSVRMGDDGKFRVLQWRDNL